ncbi:MAG: hypothetical protein ACYTGV_05890, partial [Planctomycetota bacterium]
MHGWNRALGLLVIAALATAQGTSPFKGPTRDVSGPEGRIMIKVPEQWRDAELMGTTIISIVAPGGSGGHIVRVQREEGQLDRDKQRKRYLEFDSAKYPDAKVRQMTEPYFGYRVDSAKSNRILVRAFYADGGDGLVVTATSRLSFYDKLYAEQITAIVSSLWASSVGSPEQPETKGARRRLFSKRAEISLVAPGAWKPLPPEAEGELLFIALKGSKGGPRFLVKDWGGPSSAALTLLKVSGQWKKAYGNVSLKRLGDDPPCMLVRNRVPGSVDYLMAYENADRGYTLQLTVREGSFERLRDVADQVARTLCFTGAAYQAPEPASRDIRREHGKLAVLYASAEQASSLERVTKTLGAFERHWKKVGVGKSKGKPPLQILICARSDFAEAGHYFGTPPAAYDRMARTVVAVPPPGDDEELPMWRGLFYAALADNLLHRDLNVPAPAWLRSGLCACLDAAGRTGGAADEG